MPYVNLYFRLAWADVLDMVAAADGVRWHPRVRIERYSTDQAAYADRLLRRAAAWGHRLSIPRLGITTGRIHGDLLRLICGDPEDGVFTAEGNLCTVGGLAAIAALVTGAPAQPLSPGHTIAGVGAGDTEASPHQNRLAGDGDAASAHYQGMDATYPSVEPPPAVGVVTGQVTVAGAHAAWPWLEWCWASATDRLTPAVTGAELATLTGGTQVMHNRKVFGPADRPGDRRPGTAWVFTSEIEFS